MTLSRLLYTLFFMTCVFPSGHAADRSKEIDLAYSKIVDALPKEGQLLLAPYVQQYGHYGDNAEFESIDNSRIIGGQALQVKVKRKGKNPWDVGVYSNISGEIKKGDTVFMMFWARADSLDEENQIKTLKGVGIQQSKEPYNSIVSKDFQLTGNWKTFALAGIAQQGFEAGQTQVTYQLANDKQTIELGPVFVINLGAGVSPSTLPFISP